MGGGGSTTVANGNIASGASSTISGGNTNRATGTNCTVGGGINNNAGGATPNNNATVGGGSGNTASGTSSTVAGGINNNATGSQCTIGGGTGNASSNNTSTVAGGSGNTASGAFATVVGGASCTAGGTTSVVGGNSASDGGFAGGLVFSDSTAATTGNVADAVTFGYNGGYRFFTNTARTVGASLAAGGTAWAAICDRNMKENLLELDPLDTLKKVQKLPIYQFNYKDTDIKTIHRGPIAQDWHPLFPSAKDPLKIDMLDLDGVTLSALQGLAIQHNQLLLRVKHNEEEISQLKEQVKQLLSEKTSH